ncbi:MAG: dihydroorotase [Acidimicrobiales bacterium]
MNTTIAIKGGTVVDRHGTRRADVVVSDDGTILAVDEGLDGDRSLDASGCIVSPGFVDLHVHLRQPGKEEAETVETGARGAALGGFTAVVAMPNTTPAMDCAAVVREVIELGRDALCDVRPSAAITVGRAGDALTPMAELVRLGVRVFTDDGTGVQDDRLMRSALDYAASLRHLSNGQPIVLAQRCEVSALSEGGYMREGEWSSRLGIPGQPARPRAHGDARHRTRPPHGESRALPAPVHGGVGGDGPDARPPAYRSRRAATHHFCLTDACCADYDPVFKVHPPLRTDADVVAVKEGLVDGTIGAIATDHAPHTTQDKEQTFADAPPRMLGLETAFALANTHLEMPIESILAAMSWRPAAIARLEADHGGPIEAGRAANLAIVDPDATWVVSGEAMASRSRNTPYEGMQVRGRVRHTI